MVIFKVRPDVPILCSTTIIILLLTNVIILEADPETGSSEVSLDETKRTENIAKPELDKRTYRGLTLKNDLKVLLISDSTTEAAAVSMTINIGTLNDPPDLPGLTVLLGYELQLRSKLDAKKNGFLEFVFTHGGSMEPVPSVKEHRQNFSFRIEPDQLALALKKFAEFFLDPMLDSLNELELQLAMRDVQAHSISQNPDSESWRVFEPEKVLSKEGHPFRKDYMGDMQALNFFQVLRGMPLSERLRQFHAKWYSSNIMCLTVLGKESLNDLEAVVKPLFENVENKKVEIKMFALDEHPWGLPQLKNRVYSTPTPDMNSAQTLQGVTLYFRVNDVLGQYKIAPATYVSKLIGRRGPGSLFYALEERSFVVNMSTEYETTAGIAFFRIHLLLTNEGVDNEDDVVELVFQYIDLLSTEGVEEWIFNEQRKMGEFNFYYKDLPVDESPLSYVENLASAMHDYPIEDILSYEYLRDQWDPSFKTCIKNFLAYLVPDNMNLVLVSHKFKDIVERGTTNHKIKKIPKKTLKRWKTAKTIPELQLPTKNIFIPENIDLYSPTENAPKNPYLIRQNSMLQIWFKQDVEFKTRKLFAAFQVYCPVTQMTWTNRLLFGIFVEMLQPSLLHHMYSATEAGIHWEVNLCDYGLDIRFHGFPIKLALSMEKLFLRITHMEHEPNLRKAFEIAKNRYIAAVNNEMEEYKSVVLRHMRYFLSEHTWNVDYIDRSTVLKDLQYDDLMNLLPKIFSRVFVQGLIYGNYFEENAEEDIVYSVERGFGSTKRLLPQQLLPPRIMNLEDGSHVVFKFHVQNFEDPDVLFYYSVYLFDAEEDYDMGILLLYIFGSSCSTIIPAQEPGKIECLLLEVIVKPSIAVAAQWTSSDARYLNSRVEKFFETVLIMLERMTDEEFEKRRKRAIKWKLARKQTSRRLFDRYWLEITHRRDNFEEIDSQLEQLMLWRKQDVITFFKEKFITRWTRVTATSSTPISDQSVEITDLTAWKNNLSMLPLKFSPSVTLLGSKNSRTRVLEN